MKKRKPMESPSIRSYEERVRKNLLNNMVWISAVLFFTGLAPLHAANRAFIIYDQGVDLAAEADLLQKQGARIHQVVPPQIIVANLANTKGKPSIPRTKTIYTSAIPLSVLEPMGPVAMGAGIQWNRGMIRSAKANGQSMGAMRTLVAQKSLPAPTGTSLISTSEGVLKASWESVDGALYYEVETALDSAFSEIISKSRTNLLNVNLPTFEGTGQKRVYLRVRGVDTVDNEDETKEELYGGFSRIISGNLPGTPSQEILASPTLTSPIPNFTSQGFTLILEWNSGATSQARVQVSRSRNFNETIFDAISENGEYVIPSPGLRIGETLYWRVKSWASNKSPWSDIRSLKIGPPQHEQTDMFVNPEAPK